VRAKRVLFPDPKGLEPAYYVELDLGRATSTDSDMMAFVVSATKGDVLWKRDLTQADAYSYRVYADDTGSFTPWDGPQGTAASPHPIGAPTGYQAPFVAPKLVTLESAPYSKNDPWLPPGAADLTGNNAMAYADLIAPDGFNAHPPAPADGGAPDGGASTDEGDLAVTPTGPSAFDRTYDHAQQPSASHDQIRASTTNLFFMMNWLHDWYYDAGYDEAAGNSQKENFGRGGLGDDPIKSESQDFSGRNNANASTPADGKSPRIQMYLFDGNGIAKLTVGPGPTAGEMTVAAASFGPKAFTLTGDVVVGAPLDACVALTNADAVVGKIALVDRGTCPFADKVKNAQAAGAIGVLVANNSPTGLPGMGGADAAVTIPSFGISQANGAALKAQLAAGTPANVTLRRDPVTDRDGSFDNSVVFHEWGHVISNRLVGNAAGLDNMQGRGMGEGWGDFVALLGTVRTEDVAAATNRNWTGTYATGGFDSSGGETPGYYFGFRRFPYSVDMTKNPLTFQHVQDGVPIPTTAPISPSGGGATNSQVHNVGEVWASMLWECYVALLRDTPRLPFAEAQRRMKGYLVASLKLTPNSPTILEARDAVLAAAYASDKQDYELFTAAFARRGAGTGAKGPDRDTEGNIGVAESFTVSNDLEFVDATLDDGAQSCDRDGILDSGETGKLTVRVKNRGLRSLYATTGVASSGVAGLTFAGGGRLTFPPSQPFQIVSATIDVTAAGLAPLTVGDIDVELGDQALPALRAIYGKTKATFQLDEQTGAEATDTFDVRKIAWAPGHDTNLGGTGSWSRGTDVANGWLHGDAIGTTGDHWVTSPALQVAASGELAVTMKHRYSFEQSGTGATLTSFDGGIIEISSDGGQTWSDIGETIAGYDGTLLEEGSDNPLKGRKAFTGNSADYPAYQTKTLGLGPSYAGKSVLLRFRIGTDQGAGGPGWDIDEIAFTGITNKPFPVRVADRAKCVNKAPLALAAEISAPERSTVVLPGKATDAEGNPLTYAWKQVEGPTVQLSDPTAAEPTFTAPEVTATTKLRFELRVSDGAETSAPANVGVTVTNVNRAPTASAGAPVAVEAGGDATLDGSRSVDPDGDTLTYAWTQISGPPVGMEKATDARVTFKAPPGVENATLWFSLVVSDGTTSSAPSTVAVAVKSKLPVGPASGSATEVNTLPVGPRTDTSSGCAVSAAPDAPRSTGTWGFAGLGLALAALGRRLRRR